MAAIHIKQEDFDKQVKESTVPVMVDFYADWCGPCKAAAPVLDELSDEGQGKYQIMKINVDENQEIAQEYGVMSIPTVILFKNGEEVDRQIGYAGKDGYVQLLSKGV